jgi:hypothetical protein
VNTTPGNPFANRAYQSGTPEQDDWNKGNNSKNNFITGK